MLRAVPVRVRDSLPDSSLSPVRWSAAPRLVWSLAHCLTGAVVPLLAAWTSIILFTFHFPPILALLLTCSVVRLSLVLGWSLLAVAGRSAPLLGCSSDLGSVPSSLVLRLRKVCLILAFNSCNHVDSCFEPCHCSLLTASILLL